MYLGIEIGGTKLQLGVGDGLSPELVAFERRDIDPRREAAGILEQIDQVTAGLRQRCEISRVGFGFGGPVDSAAGRTIISHQVEGWRDFPLAAWCRNTCGVPAVLGNDCDVAALAEARYGAGRGKATVFYVTVGTGVGGGFVHDGVLHGRGRPAVAEIGHLRPGLHADTPDATVESAASGTGIAEAAKTRISGEMTLPFISKSRSVRRLRTADVDETAATDFEAECRRDLLDRAGGELDGVTGKLVGQAAADGNPLAIEVLEHACLVLGWAVAQTITLLAPEVVVVGGGVSLLGEDLFFAPLRRAVRQYVFPPLAASYEIVPAALGELVVVHGAVALAASAAATSGE